MDRLEIQGGIPLNGEVAVSGAKNAALPIMAAAILAEGPVRLSGVPQLADVDTLSLVLGYLGVEVKRQRDGRLHIDTRDPRPVWADYELVRRMRASFCVLGPLLARRGRARVALPGGCKLGDRPVDLHLKGLAALGADIRLEHGDIIASARQLTGATIDLAGPCGPTVTGTANVLCAATLARGRTIITGAAQEPEIVDLGHFLIALGAQIDGLGTSTLEITGVGQLGGADYTIIPDRIETATLLIAGVITGGQVTVRGARAEHLSQVLSQLDQAGARLQVSSDAIRIESTGSLRPLDLTASPYPGVPTDVQSQLTALCALASGQSRVRDSVFGERFQHVPELRRLGAQIARDGATATITGVARLSGADVTATDLRASAALVLAGLAAHGETCVHEIHHLDRGYEWLEEKLRSLGANIERRGWLGSNEESRQQNGSGGFAPLDPSHPNPVRMPYMPAAQAVQPLGLGGALS